MKQLFSDFLKRMLHMLSSFKTYVILLSSYLLWFKKIDGFTWSSVVIAIAVGRTALEGLAMHKSGKKTNIEE